MTKVSDLTTVTSGYLSNEQLNANFEAIETAFANTLSRDGSTPNSMSASLDMNSQRIINLPAPAAASDAARLQDVTSGVQASFQATSSSSIAIGTGSKTFTIESGKFFNVGSYLLIASDADETNYMHGQITSYSSTTLIVNVTSTGGGGTFTDWVITISGVVGPAGMDGPMTGPVTSTDNAIVRFNGTDGTTVQDSGVIIDDSDNITGVASIDIGGTIAVDAVLDEDDMSSDSATGVPTQQSVKAYVDNNAAPNPNLLFNGQFRIAQRGTTFTSTTTPANSDDTYLFDRWNQVSDGNDIADYSQDTTTVPTGTYSSAKVDQETANKQWGLVQILEAKDAASIIGGSASLSFKARKGPSNTTAETLRAAIISWSSTADTVTSDVVGTWAGAGTNPTLASNWTYENTPSNLTLTTSFQTFTIENISIDTASTNNVAVFIWLDDTDATVGDLVYITDVKLEKGSTASTYIARSFEEELNLCERYYEKTYATNTFAGNTTRVSSEEHLISTAIANGVNLVSQRYRTRKFKTPSVTLYAVVSGTSGSFYDINGGADKSGSVTQNSDAGFAVQNSSGGALTAGRNFGWHWVAEAEL